LIYYNLINKNNIILMELSEENIIIKNIDKYYITFHNGNMILILKENQKLIF